MRKVCTYTLTLAQVQIAVETLQGAEGGWDVAVKQVAGIEDRVLLTLCCLLVHLHMDHGSKACHTRQHRGHCRRLASTLPSGGA